MDNNSSALKGSARARHHINPSTRPVAQRKSIHQLAAENTASADTSTQISQEVEESSSRIGDKKMLWYTFGISVGVLLLGFVALRYKLIKLS